MDAQESSLPTTEADIIKIQRSLSRVPKKSLKKFVNKLKSDDLRWVLGCYLKTFLPHCPSKDSLPRMPINQVHLQKLDNISKTRDLNVIKTMNKVLVRDYYRSLNEDNPLSVNTAKKFSNKCQLLKKISNDVLSLIGSFFDCQDRALYKRVCWTFFDSLNDNNAKYHSSLTESVLRDATVSKSLTHFYDCKYLSFDCNFSSITRGSKKESNLKKVIQHSPNLEKLRIEETTPWSMHRMHGMSFVFNRFFQENEANFRRVKGLEWKSHQWRSTPITFSVQTQLQLMTKMFPNLSSFYFDIDCNSLRTPQTFSLSTIDMSTTLTQTLCTKGLLRHLQHLDMNLSFDCESVWAPKSILFHLCYFSNLQFVKLTLSLPQSVTAANSYINNLMQCAHGNIGCYAAFGNKLSKLQSVILNFNYVTIASERDWNGSRSYEVRYRLGSKALQVNKPSYWNEIVLNTVEYFALLSENNIEEFSIQCPQWKDDTASAMIDQWNSKSIMNSIFAAVINNKAFSESQGTRFLKKLKLYVNDVTLPIAISQLFRSHTSFVSKQNFVKELTLDIYWNGRGSIGSSWVTHVVGVAGCQSIDTLNIVLKNEVDGTYLWELKALMQYFVTYPQITKVKSLKVEFDTEKTFWQKDICWQLVKTMTQLTTLTTVKQVILPKTSFKKDHFDYFRFWYTYPFGDCTVAPCTRTNHWLPKKYSLSVWQSISNQ